MSDSPELFKAFKIFIGDLYLRPALPFYSLSFAHVPDLLPFQTQRSTNISHGIGAFVLFSMRNFC